MPGKKRATQQSETNRGCESSVFGGTIGILFWFGVFRLVELPFQILPAARVKITQLKDNSKTG